MFEIQDYINELVCFASLDQYEIAEDVADNFIDDLLLDFSVNKQTLEVVENYHTSNTCKGWGIDEIDLCFGNFTMYLPNPSLDFEYYMKVRCIILKHFESKLKEVIV